MEMEMEGGNGGEVRVPPGFRFHPTDEELLYYYLKKKVSYEPIDLDVIREVDLNKLEPWDIREKCRIGTGPQNDWYLFSHKDKKYPTGTRTNRATIAGFWKATGRDKAIFLSNTNVAKRIGMRKTLVFYIGRAPHGHKTDWIMHEYRLDDGDHHSTDIQQEDGWVVCRVFKKKNHTTSYQAQADVEEEAACNNNNTRSSLVGGSSSNINPLNLMGKQSSFQQQSMYGNGGYHNPYDGSSSSMNLPHLASPDAAAMQQPSASTFLSPMSLMNSTGDLECSNNLLTLTSAGPTLAPQASEQHRFSGESWFFLDKLLTNYQTLDHQKHHQVPPENVVEIGSSSHHHHHQKFPFQYLGCEPDVLKYSNINIGGSSIPIFNSKPVTTITTATTNTRRAIATAAISFILGKSLTTLKQKEEDLLKTRSQTKTPYSLLASSKSGTIE
ncbi:hypothetical protein V2J09_018796 [Rumex salicifolius]